MSDALINEREKTHGSFAEGAAISQSIKLVMHKSPNWSSMPDQMREALDMIAHKMQRILVGNQFEKDHWYDIAGYARLISRELENEGF